MSLKLPNKKATAVPGIQDEVPEAVKKKLVRFFSRGLVVPAVRALFEIELGDDPAGVRARCGFDPLELLPRFCPKRVLVNAFPAVAAVTDDTVRSVLVSLMLRIHEKIEHDTDCQCDSIRAQLQNLIEQVAEPCCS